jgi:membrane protein required for colicin V production
MGQLSVTAIDILVVVVILVSTGYAAFRGLVRETFAILEWVAAAYVALRFTPLFQPLLHDYISPPWLEWIAVFAGTFLLVFIPLSIMSHRLSEVVKKSDVGPIDHTFGLVYGVGRGLVIVGLAYIAFAALVPAENHPDMLTKARLFPLIRNTSDVLRSLTPQESNGVAASGEASSPTPPSTAAKAYGADDRGALDRLLETNGGDANPSR